MTFDFKPGEHHLIPTVELGPVKTWSFSSLSKFEKCPYAVYLGKVEGFREPSGPAADRGTKIHTHWEEYIRGDIEHLTEGGKKPDLQYARELRELYADGLVTLEDEWVFTKDWEITTPGAPDVWAVFKLDVFIRESPESARIIDHKSGQIFGNEIKHGDQGMLYAIAAMMRFPELQFVSVEFNYVDHGKVAARATWTRNDLTLFLPRLEKRALAMTTATTFPPKPSTHNCRWCRMKDEVTREDGQPACKWGVLA
jgi:hypothetical protein